MKYQATINCKSLVGGIPSHPSILRGWLQTNLGEKKAAWPEGDVQVAVDFHSMFRGTLPEEEKKNKSVNGFLRDPKTGQLLVEGRVLGAALRQAYASTNGAKSFTKKEKDALPEIRVEEGLIPLFFSSGEPVLEAPIRERVSHSPMTGASIAREEVLHDVLLSFTVSEPEDFECDWADLWTMAELKGIGSCRSMGEGCFVVVEWEPASEVIEPIKELVMETVVIEPVIETVVETEAVIEPIINEPVIPDSPRATIICRECGEEFDKPTTRGRPPVRCFDCRTK